MTIVDLQISRTYDICHSAKKIFQLEKQTTLKMACAILAMFNSSLKVTTEKMSAVEIYETAVMFCDKYTHESISDLMLCLKMVKNGELGTIYNRFDTVTFFQFFVAYLDRKWQYHEESLRRIKSDTDGSVNTQYHTDMLRREREEKNKLINQAYDESKKIQNVIDSFKAKNQEETT